MKRKISLMIILILLLQIIIPMASIIWESGITLISRAEETEEATVDGITWIYILENGNATNVGPKDINTLPTEIIIPDELNGNTVTSIKGCAFSECSSLERVVIPEGVTRINEGAFDGCSSLISVNIPNGVKSLSLYAFRDCSSLESIDIPEGVESIGWGTFSGCSSLTNVSIPSTVTDIWYPEFQGCSNLESIIVSDNNKNFIDIDGVLFNKKEKKILRYPEAKQGTGYTIPEWVEIIENCAFYGCSNLKSVNIPNSVKDISLNAFANCSSLESIDIPEGINSIGWNIFSGCSSLESIEIPESVTRIGDYAFKGCSSLESIEIPESVTSIGDRAFSNCSGLTSIKIPREATNIQHGMLEGCINLARIEVDEENTTYSSIDGVLFNKKGEQLIYYPPGKKEIEYMILENTTSIHYYAFDYNIYLENITVDQNNKKYSSKDGLLFDKAGTKLIRYSPGRKKENFIIPEGVTSIGNYAFHKCKALKSIEITNDIISIGNYAFYGCSNLQDVEIGNKVTSIGNHVFHECSDLRNVKIGNNVKSIGKATFEDCISLTSIEIPESVTTMGGYMFQECSNLRSIRIPDKVTSIGEWAFYKCKKLESIEIGKNVQSIERYAFDSCDNLKSIEIPNTVISIGENAFYRCNDLVIYCKLGSEAQKHALSNNLLYMAIEEYEKEEKNANRYIKNINPETIKEEVLAKIETNGEVKVYKEGTEVENPDTNIGTGMVIEISLNGETVQYQAVVIGDCNGNGRTNVADLTTLMQSRAECLGTNRNESKILKGAYEKAVDLNGDGKISVSDITNLCKYIAEHK